MTPSISGSRGLSTSGSRRGARSDAAIRSAKVALDEGSQQYGDDAWRERAELLGDMSDQLMYIHEFQGDRIERTKKILEEWTDAVKQSRREARLKAQEAPEVHAQRLKEIDDVKNAVLQDILKHKNEQARLELSKSSIVRKVDEVNEEQESLGKQAKYRLPLMRDRINIMRTILGTYIFPSQADASHRNVVKGFIGADNPSDLNPFSYDLDEQPSVDVADDIWTKIHDASLQPSFP